MRRVALLAAAVLAGVPATAQAVEYRIVEDSRGTEVSDGRSLRIVVERDGEIVATYAIPTATLRAEAGRRLRVTLRRRPLIEFREPFSPPPEREPDMHLVDLPLWELIPSADARESRGR
jgi:hypothetical protein